MKSSGLTYRHPASRRHREGGFALLLVFLMAAIIGITLFMELPRVAFEVQRQKEQLLMERGEQYQIAIRRYMQRGLKQGVNSGPPATWPGKVEDLENTNGRRFLRKRYIDPMTGKDEWRIIHINNGILTDSLNNKQQGQGQNSQAATGGQGITEFKGLGDATAGPSLQGAAAASRRRASDSSPTSGPGNGPPMDPNASGGSAPPAGPTGTGQSPQSGGSASGGPSMPFPGQSGQPGQQFGGSGMPPAQQGNTGAASSGSGISSTGGISSFGGGISTTTSSSTTPSGGQAFGQLPPGVPGAPASSVYGGSPYSTAQGANGTVSPGFPQPGVGTSQTPTSVSNLLNNMLTTPRPGGMPQVTPTGAAGGTAMGGGIAGVASKLDADSIMVCGDHSNYQEWEFIFDPSKWKAPNNPNTKLGGTPAGASGAPGSGGPAGQPIGQTIGQQIGTPIGGTAQPSGGNMGASGQGRTNGQGGQNGMGAMGQSNISNICGMGTTRPGAQ